MKKTINNEKTLNKTLEFDENVWTGKRSIKYDGVELTKIKRNIYEYRNGDQVEQFKITGNQFAGISVNMFNNEVMVERKLTWYEILLSILVFAPCVLFGLIGGIFGGLLGATNLILIKQFDKWYIKVIASIAFLIAGLLLSYVFAVIILKAMSL